MLARPADARRTCALSAVLTTLVVIATPAEAAPDKPSCVSAPTKSETAEPWAQRMLAPERIWPMTKGEGVTVAVLDSGVDATNPQLSGAVSSGIDVLNPVGEGDAKSDCLGHGTFVAGIIAARPREGTGFIGMAPAAAILSVRYADSHDNGEPNVMAKAIRQAVDAGAKVLNVSASTGVADDELKSAVDYAASRDVLVVAAVANGGKKNSGSRYPAAYPGVLAVGAIDPTGQPAEYSQRSPYVALAAPGTEVVSVAPGGPGHRQDSGTSFATAFVSGAAALVRSYRPTMTAPEVARRLTDTAVRPAGTVPDAAVGWGTLDVYAAVVGVLPGEPIGQDRHAVVRHPDVPGGDQDATRLLIAVSVGSVGLITLIALVTSLATGLRRRRP